METLSDIVVFQTLPDGSLLSITKFSKLLDPQLFAGLVGAAHHLGSGKLSSPYRPIDPVGGNRPRVLTEADNRRFRSSGK